jgi:ribosomal protein S18 acetylase RimI-like enzyme
MLRIRRMQRYDIPFAIRLTNRERWGIPQRDFERILKLDPRGSFIATEGTKRIGLATSASYGREIAWIGNVVVQKQHRGKHVGQALVTHAVDYLNKKHVKHVALYCFDENVEFYKKLGFLKGPSFGRLRRKRKKISQAAPEFSAHTNLPLPAILTVDKKAFGADRSTLIRDLLRSNAARILSVDRRNGLAYLLVKNYEDMCELGPWVSFRVNSQDLDSMLHQSLVKAGGKAVEVSVPLRNGRVLRMLKRYDFRVVRTGLSMYFDEVPRIGSPAAVLALGFLDKG